MYFCVDKATIRGACLRMLQEMVSKIKISIIVLFILIN